MAAGGGIDPIHQFEIKPIVGLKLFGLDLSFTNSALFMVLTVAVVALITPWPSSSCAGWVTARCWRCWRGAAARSTTTCWWFAGCG